MIIFIFIIPYTCSPHGVLHFFKTLSMNIHITYCHLPNILNLVSLFFACIKRNLKKQNINPLNHLMKKMMKNFLNFVKEVGNYSPGKFDSCLY